ncbi:MAG TPA: hypothetical protein VM325_12050 [Alphaproteobacteria bacterium]|nr:hypothetical protein [Alphaproteobacteria bacterium]
MAQTSEHGQAGAAHRDMPPPINFANLIWVAAALAVMVGGILAHDRWLLNFVHVMTGVLWTGIDLFMGFVVGPIMRRMDPASRTALTTRLVPRMLFLMPTLSISGGTSGWFLAEQLGYFDLAAPALYWVIAAVAILVILTVQGLGFLLPTNVRVYLELRKDQPDAARIARLMRAYIYVIASQGVLQVVMIVIMARFVSGL